MASINVHCHSCVEAPVGSGLPQGTVKCIGGKVECWMESLRTNEYLIIREGEGECVINDESPCGSFRYVI